MAWRSVLPTVDLWDVPRVETTVLHLENLMGQHLARETVPTKAARLVKKMVRHWELQMVMMTGLDSELQMVRLTVDPRG